MPPLLRRLLLLAILVYGTFVRLDNLSFGLPAPWHPDETQAAAAVTNCMLGKPLTLRYRHPPLLNAIACRIDDVFVAPYTSRYLRKVPHSYLSLRLVSAAAGSATIVLVYLLALRVAGTAAALGAALFFAGFPAAVMSAKYGVPDALLTMFMTAALWLQLRMLEQPSPGRYFLAALTTTLAVTAKYNGGFVAFSFVAAHLVAVSRKQAPLVSPRHIGVSLAAIAIGLVAGFPRAFFGGEMETLLGGILAERQHLVSEGHHGIHITTEDPGGYVFHFIHSVMPASGPLLLGCIVAGLIALCWQRSAAVLVLMAFAVPYYFTIETIFKVPPTFERYAMPLFSIYFIGAALLLERLAGLVAGTRSRSMLFAAAVAAAACYPMWRTAVVVSGSKDDTRARMTHWIQGNLEPQDLVAAQWPMMLFYYPGPPWRGRLQSVRPELEANAHPRRDTYIVASSLMYQRYLDYPQDDPEWTRFYGSLFSRAELMHEEDAGAARYMFHNPTLRLYRLPALTPPKGNS